MLRSKLFLSAVIALAALSPRDAAIAADKARSEFAAAATTRVASEGNWLTRTEVRQLLERLQKSPPPRNLSISAARGESGWAEAEAVYLCPVCKTTTVHKREGAAPAKKSESKRDSWSWTPATDSQRSFLREREQAEEESGVSWSLGRTVSEEIPECRRLLGEISSLRAKLDETLFCRKCNAAGKPPRIGLLLRYAGENKVRRLWGVDSDDLRLIAELLAGKTKHVAGDGGESPLKNHIPRLEQLLGVATETGGE